jgi:WD40 repeat protein
VALGSDRGPITLWDPTKDGAVRRLEGHGWTVHDLAFLPDGQRLVSGGRDGMVRLWHIPTGRPTASILAHNEVWWLDVSRDGGKVVTGGRDSTVRLWRIGQSLAEDTAIRLGDARWKGIIPVEFMDAAGSRVGLAFNGQLSVWDTGKTPQPLSAVTGVEGRTLAVHPRHGLALVGDRSLAVLDTTSQQVLRRLQAHEGRMTACAWSPVSRTAFTGSTDNEVRVWDFDWLEAFERHSAQVEAAQQRILANPRDAAALATLGEWYAFRRRHDWAVDLLEQARSAGGATSPLMLARSYWMLGDAVAARREFEAAAATGEAPGEYVALCIRAAGDGPIAATQPQAPSKP